LEVEQANALTRTSLRATEYEGLAATLPTYEYSGKRSWRVRSIQRKHSKSDGSFSVSAARA